MDRPLLLLESVRYRLGVSRAVAAVALSVVVGTMSGCAIARRVPEEARRPGDSVAAAVTPVVPAVASGAEAAFEEADLPEGIFHVVQAGQTLWRIARAYGVPAASIATANGISDPTRITVGAALFVPGARTTIDIQPYPAPAPSPPPATPYAGIRDGARNWIWPLTGEVLSGFGDPRRRHRHNGVDIRGRRGEDVVAARSGRVVFAGRGGGGYGLTVVVDHGDGHQSLYAHGDSLLVGVGDEVRQGQAIARCGRTGNATTEHVHFEIRRDSVPQDPVPLLGEILEARR